MNIVGIEAWRFGFDPSLPSAFKFDPTDGDIVAHYLLPRALNLPGPHAHAVVDADPASCPPWELLHRHGYDESDHAFFFAPPRDPTRGTRANRAVRPGADGVGGTWHGQKSQTESVFLVRDNGDTIELKYKRCNLTYYINGVGTSSGWVMHEYQIVDPPLLPGFVLARVKVTEAGKKERPRQLALYRDQPGPSGNHYLTADPAAGNAVVPWNAATRTGSSAQVVVAQGSYNNACVDMSGGPVVNYTGLLLSGQDVGGYSDSFTGNVNNQFSQGADATATTTE